MKHFKLFALVAVIAISGTACTKSMLNDALGGHSPMMRLNGHWECGTYEIEAPDGTVEQQPISEEVHFNATKDQGPYCEGTWIYTQSNDDDFLWGFAEDDFVIHNDQGNDDTYKVDEQTPTVFRIHRTDDAGNVHTLTFSRDAE